VGEVEGKINGLPAQVIPQIVAAVVAQLPGFVSPVVEASLGKALAAPVGPSIGKPLDNSHETLAMKIEVLRQDLSSFGSSSPSCHLQRAPVAAPKASVGDEFREVEVDLETGMLVGIHGLQSAPALNGTVGVVHGYDGASHRYMVETESGTIRKFKRCNLVLEQEIDGVMLKRSATRVLAAAMVMIGYMVLALGAMKS